MIKLLYATLALLSGIVFLCIDLQLYGIAKAASLGLFLLTVGRFTFVVGAKKKASPPKLQDEKHDMNPYYDPKQFRGSKAAFKKSSCRRTK